jgi:TonB-linked SusC/RagA family outer membrane protein
MKKILLTCFFAAMLCAAWAQERTVTGKVTSADDGAALPGVNVLLKGTTIGTATDASGDYSLTVPQSGGTLVFTFIGLVPQEIEIDNRSVIDVSMASDVTQLTEVVVTALNIPREKASLGYATQQVSGESLTTAKQQNFVNSLSGKVAGVQIRTNNNFGGSTNVVIRGNKSVSGNNQPLYVIDGVPVNNSTGNSTFQEAGRYGYDYGNAASDINPEDIESVNVLKGAAATTLYGSRAANGVIMITTKKGKKRDGLGISVSTGVTVGQINKETFTEYQNKYGAGYAREWFEYYGPQGFFEDDVNGDGVDDLVVPTLEDGSYGAPFDPNLNVYHWDSFVPESPNYGKAYPWVAAKNTPVDFFETQMEYNNSIALSGGNDVNSFRVSYTNFKQNGILPNSELQRHNFSFTGSSKINDKLRADLNVNYARNNTLGRFSTGYGDNLMANFRQWWQTNVDIKSLEDMFKKTGRNITWNGGDYNDPETPIFWDNPYWMRFRNYQTDERNRVFGNIALTYNITDWLSVMGRVTADTYAELREERREIGSVPTEFGIPKGDGTKADEGSGYNRIDRRISEYNYDLIFTANKQITNDFSLSAILGTNIRRNRFDQIWTSTNGGLVVPGLFSINNSKLPTLLPQEEAQTKEVYGYFGNLNLGYKSMVYLDLSARNDISSALPVDNNSYFYHSEALSFVFSELLDAPFINYGKIRVNYAEVGNDTDPERTAITYTKVDNFGEATVFTYPTYVNNPELKPERTKSWEAGLEFIALDNRLNLDLAFYKTNSVDQIVEVEVSKATGMGFKYLNGGDIENRGVEMALGYDIIKNGAFKWNATLNWAKNISEVNSLPSGIENYVINSYQGGISTNATVGEPYGVFRGTGFQFLNGRKVVNASGYYVAVADQVIGDPNPDWSGGLSNAFSYKNFNLSFLIDVSRGGDVYSLDMHYGQGTGISANTAGLNELGNPVRDLVTDGEDSGGIILDGVQADGSENTVRAAADFYGGAFYWGSATRNPGQMTVYDASYVKLREVALTYRLPQGVLGNIFQGASISLVGRNLWIIDKNLPYADPESGLGAGNGQGYISGAYPTLKTYGFRLDLDF